MLTNLIIGILIVIVLAALALWRVIHRIQVSNRLALRGRTIEARVTDIKREPRLFTQTGGAATTVQRQQYEDFLYAEWKDPLTAHVYTFRIKIANFFDFHIGEFITIRMNRENPNEYQLQSAKRNFAPGQPGPKRDLASHAYQRGYVPSSEGTKPQESEFQAEPVDEKPAATYPELLQEQSDIV